MDREAFKKRMLSLKSYRELNPDKGYWDWKVQALQPGGVTDDPPVRDYVAETDAVQSYRPQIIESVERKVQPGERLITINGNKFFVKDNTPQLHSDDRTNYQKTQDEKASARLKRQYEEQKKTEEGLKQLSALGTLASPSTYIGAAFRNNENSYVDNMLSGEGFGDMTTNLMLDVAFPASLTKAAQSYNATKAIKNAFQVKNNVKYVTKIPQQTEIVYVPKKSLHSRTSLSFFERPNKLTRMELDGYPKHYRNPSRHSDLFGTDFGYYDLKTNLHESDVFVDLLGEGSEQTVFSSRNQKYVNKVYTGSNFTKENLKDWVNKFLIRNSIDYAEPISYKGFVTSKFGIHPVFRQKRLQPIACNDPNRMSIKNLIIEMYKNAGYNENMVKNNLQLNDMQILNFAYDLNGNLKAIDVDVYPIDGFKCGGQIPSYEDGGEVHDAGMLPEVVVTPEERQVEEPGLWDKFTNTVSVLYNNAARKIKNFFEEEDVGEVIDLSNQQVTRVTPDTKNLTAIYGNEFVESAANNIRTKKQFEETTDTLIGDKKIPLSKISTFYGIENGKLKAGPLSTFSDNTTVIANRAKNIGKVKEIYRISEDSEDYKWAKQYDALNKTKNLIKYDSLRHHFLDSLGIEYNDKWYNSIIGQKSSHYIVTRMYYDKNTDEYTKKYIRDVVWNHSTEDQKRANKILLRSLPHLITEKNDTLPFTSARVYGPKYLFSNEYGDAVFVYRPNKLSNALLDSLNTKLKESPMYPILIDNGRYSHYQTNSPNYTTYTAYDFARDPKNMYVIGTTNSYEYGGETGELSKEDEQRLSNAIIHSIRKDNMDVAKSLMQRGSDEYIPIPHPQPGIASLVGDPTMLPYLDTASDMYNLAQSVYEKDPAGTAINALALTLPYATSKTINKITRPIPTVKGYKESVEAQMNAVLARLKADLAKQAEWDNMVFRSAERVYDQDVIDRAIETGTVDRLNQVKDLYENNLENLPKVRMVDNLPNGERGRIQLTPEAEVRHKAGISPEDKDFEILVDKSIDPNQEIIDHEFRHFNQYMEKGSPDINTTATSTRSGVKPSKRNKLDPARSTYFGKEGESEAYLKNIYEDMKNNGFDPNNYSDFKKYLKGLSDRDSKKKAVAQFRSNIDAFKFMKKMPLIAATGVGLTAMNQNKEQSN